MVVVVPDSAPLLDLQSDGGQKIGCQLSFDETSYREMLDALDRVISAKGNRLAYLRDLFYGPQPAQTYGFGPVRLPWLNGAQEQAVSEVVRAKDVMVVHGPPGTGKTTTLVEAINETLMRESQVLVCAQSNMAVDWISEKLVDRAFPYCALVIPRASTTRCWVSPMSDASRPTPTIPSFGPYARLYANCGHSVGEAVRKTTIRNSKG